MLTSLLAAWRALSGVFKVFAFIKKYPKLSASIVAIIAIVVLTWMVADHFVTARVKKEEAKVIEALQEQVKKANAETALRDAKIARIEKDSKTSADILEAQLSESKKEMTLIVSAYEKRLKDEKKNYRVIYVKDKDTGKDVEVNLNPQGEVVCRLFPDAFRTTVNDLVREVNRKGTK